MVQTFTFSSLVEWVKVMGTFWWLMVYADVFLVFLDVQNSRFFQSEHSLNSWLVNKIYQTITKIVTIWFLIGYKKKNQNPIKISASQLILPVTIQLL